MVQITINTDTQGPVHLSNVELTTYSRSTLTAGVTTTATGHAIETVITSLPTLILDHIE